MVSVVSMELTIGQPLHFLSASGIWNDVPEYGTTKGETERVLSVQPGSCSKSSATSSGAVSAFCTSR
jgi:hypothetical protein